jgi:hypothetical protein
MPDIPYATTPMDFCFFYWKAGGKEGGRILRVVSANGHCLVLVRPDGSRKRLWPIPERMMESREADVAEHYLRRDEPWE